ncbi:MAG: zf-HC2 domain-containing protein [Candidatus Competibacter sp.]|nr:zf-HC2 domain-containing protein [Candidatus Competibacter sp.]
MRDCPSDLLLTLFLEGRLSDDETVRVRRHVARCPACARAAAAGLALQDLETAGALPAVEAREAAGAARRLAELAKASVGDASTSGSPKDPDSGLSSRFKRLLGGFVAAAGLAKWHEVLEHAAHMPGLAKADENNSSASVRKDGLPASQSATDDHGNASGESPTMTGPSTISFVEHAPTTLGLPGVDGRSPWVQQQYEDTCAIRCQELILRDFGVSVPEDALRREAATYGWYEPGGGTSPDNVGNLLELHGVPVHRYENATIFNLTSELAQGHKVIVGVDSGELWNAGLLEHVEDQLGLPGADHALLVSGIDTTDPEQVQVILTDPGSGDVAKVYPLEQFVEAWKDSRCFMVATQEPAPLEFNPSMVNFDYAMGHLASIGQLPYDDFQHLLSSDSEFDLSVAVLNNQVDKFSGMVAEEWGIENTLPDSEAGQCVGDDDQTDPSGQLKDSDFV